MKKSQLAALNPRSITPKLTGRDGNNELWFYWHPNLVSPSKAAGAMMPNVLQAVLTAIRQSAQSDRGTEASIPAAEQRFWTPLSDEDRIPLPPSSISSFSPASSPGTYVEMDRNRWSSFTGAADTCLLAVQHTDLTQGSGKVSQGLLMLFDWTRGGILNEKLSWTTSSCPKANGYWTVVWKEP